MTRAPHSGNGGMGTALPRAFLVTTPEEFRQTLDRADQAARPYAAVSSQRRSEFLQAAARAVRQAGSALVSAAMRETGLTEARLTGEVERTASQLEFFARTVLEGSWVDARIDRARPDRTPVPKPDVRSMRVPLGVVAVFGASNFPLAFSTAGGDTASALAAGCPVVVKAHPAHPETALLAAEALEHAAHETGMPEGTFGIVFGEGPHLGQELVKHPAVRAVGFTGSRAGGLALEQVARARPVPIPVYAEMSSVNPVVITSRAARREGLPRGLAASITGSGGQLCTQPGLVFIPAGADGDALLGAVAEQVRHAEPCALLTPAIQDAYLQGIQRVTTLPGVHVHAAAGGPALATPAVIEVTLEDFQRHPALSQENFGPSSVAVRYRHVDDLPEVITRLEGQLTATLHADPDELPDLTALCQALIDRAGRFVFNGYPTGVEVGAAMVHGGPYPATTDGVTTSVGSHAMHRFTRLMAYQNLPDAALPAALQDANPLHLWRQVDGEWTNKGLTPGP